jgi:hypothetical protein
MPCCWTSTGRSSTATGRMRLRGRTPSPLMAGTIRPSRFGRWSARAEQAAAGAGVAGRRIRRREEDRRAPHRDIQNPLHADTQAHARGGGVRRVADREPTGGRGRHVCQAGRSEGVAGGLQGARNDALKADLSQVREGATRESDERRKADEMLSEKLKQLAVGGLNLEAIGLVWLLLGTVGTSIPEEVVWVIRRLF